MGETNPNYPVMEVAISLEDAPDNASGTERKKVGDIVAIRKPGSYCGSQETKLYMWIRIEGPEENEFAYFGRQVYEPTDPLTGVIFDKRRYCIPLDRLQIVYPALNQARALDPLDFYQPFITVDSEDFSFVAADPPYQVSGLVFDKVIGDYL